jgi:hypothetical protein
MGRLGDRFPLGSIGYGPVLGGYLEIFFGVTVGSGFFLIKKIQITVRIQVFSHQKFKEP